MEGSGRKCEKKNIISRIVRVFVWFQWTHKQCFFSCSRNDLNLSLMTYYVTTWTIIVSSLVDVFPFPSEKQVWLDVVMCWNCHQTVSLLLDAGHGEEKTQNGGSPTHPQDSSDAADRYLSCWGWNSIIEIAIACIIIAGLSIMFWFRTMHHL